MTPERYVGVGIQRTDTRSAADIGRIQVVHHEEADDDVTGDPGHVLDVILGVLEDLGHDNGNENDEVVIHTHGQRMDGREALKHDGHEQEVPKTVHLGIHLFLIGEEVGRDGEKGEQNDHHVCAGLLHLNLIFLAHDGGHDVGCPSKDLLIEGEDRPDGGDHEPQLVLLQAQMVQGVIEQDHERRMVEAEGDQRKEQEPKRLLFPRVHVRDQAKSDGERLAESREDHDEHRHVHEQDHLQKAVLSVLGVELGNRQKGNRRGNRHIDLEAVRKLAHDPVQNDIQLISVQAPQIAEIMGSIGLEIVLVVYQITADGLVAQGKEHKEKDEERRYDQAVVQGLGVLSNGDIPPLLDSGLGLQYRDLIQQQGG